MQTPMNSVIAAFALFAAAASAAPVSVNGVLGAEWAGTTFKTVTHNAAAPNGNFGKPGNINDGASYKVGVRADAGYVYVGLEVTGDASYSAGNFANLYFSTNPGSGSNLGIEVTNNRYFIPGSASYFDASPYLTFDAKNPGIIELAIDNSFFTSGLQGTTPASMEVQLRLSQSFGYSVAGGASYGADRLGVVKLVPAATVPEPGVLALSLAALGGLAVARRLRAAR